MKTKMALSAVRKRFTRGVPGLLGCVALTLSGCNGFFVRETGGTTPTGSGNYAYVSDSATGSTYINGYSLASGTLVSTTGSPYQLNFTPTSMVITPANTFLYAATDPVLFNGAVYLYSIGTGGSLTLANNSLAVASENVSSMDVSPDGKWFFALDSGGLTLEEYAINSSTGVLTFQNTIFVTGTAGAAVTPAQVRVSPSGNFVVCALGTAGTQILPFNTSTGVLNVGFTVATGSQQAGDYAVALDGSDNLYIARTTGLAVYTLASTGNPTAVTGSPFPAGNAPRSIVLSSGYGDLYAGNQADSTLSEFSVASGGALTALTGSPFTGPASVGALGRDSTGKYILAAGYNGSTGLQLYTVGSGGGLSLTGSAPTGATAPIPAIPIAIALTH